MDDMLYAWADTTHVGVGDHTWVTTYSPGSGNSDPSKGDYWYCWGDPHSSSRELAAGSGGCEFARHVAKPHDRTENVGIRYARDGLCHQMANRLLRFASADGKEGLKVFDASGYQLSVAMFGEYGGKSITSSKECAEKWEKTVAEYEKKRGKKP
jgi:hypothetical protein